MDTADLSLLLRICQAGAFHVSDLDPEVEVLCNHGLIKIGEHGASITDLGQQAIDLTLQTLENWLEG